MKQDLSGCRRSVYKEGFQGCISWSHFLTQYLIRRMYFTGITWWYNDEGELVKRIDPDGGVTYFQLNKKISYIMPRGGCLVYDTKIEKYVPDE